jgi:hypothetical protein
MEHQYTVQGLEVRARRRPSPAACGAVDRADRAELRGRAQPSNPALPPQASGITCWDAAALGARGPCERAGGRLWACVSSTANDAQPALATQAS